MVGSGARKALRLGVAAVTLVLVLCGNAQNNRKVTTDVSESEYEVYSAYIRASFIGKAGEEHDRYPASNIVIADSTQSDQNDVAKEIAWAELTNYLRQEEPTLQLTTIDAFRQANGQQTELASQFRLPVAYQLVSATKVHEILDGEGWWSDYYRKYPASQGFLTLSRVGFSPDGRQALLYASNRCGGKCATGAYAVLEKNRTSWIFVKEIIVWMS